MSLDERIVAYLFGQPTGVCSEWLSIEFRVSTWRVAEALGRLTLAGRVRNAGFGRPLWKVKR